MIDSQKFLSLRVGDDSPGFQQHDTRPQQQSFTQVVSDENDSLAQAAG